MNTEDALQFLEQHQPMPGDSNITQEQCDLFMSTLKHFSENPDERCIPLLINAVSNETGLGMYEMIGDVLIEQKRENVVEALKTALSRANDAVKYRCCWWATDIDAWDLEALIWPLKSSENEDLIDAAEAYIKLKHENV